MNWQPIETAPQDGSPVWARGANWNDSEKGTHYVWAYWKSGAWREAGLEESELLYLREWLPLK